MRQLRLAETPQNVWDWILEQDAQGIVNLEHDPDWHATNALLEAAFPASLFDAEAAARAWKHEQIVDARHRHGQRPVPPALLTTANPSTDTHAEPTTGRPWEQMTLFDYIKYEAANTRGFNRDKAARDARITAWVAGHKDTGETVRSLTRKINQAVPDL
jgi:hypothetical protein